MRINLWNVVPDFVANASLHLVEFNKLRQFERSIKWNWTWLCSQKVNGWALETRDMTRKCSLWHVQFIHFTQLHAVCIHLIMCGNGNSQWNNPPQLAIRKTLTICFSRHLNEKKKIAHRKLPRTLVSLRSLSLIECESNVEMWGGSLKYRDIDCKLMRRRR